MRHETAELLRDQGRGAVGALLLGTPLLFTMETWWIAWRLPMPAIVGFAAVGLALIVGLVRSAGFREASDRPRTPMELAQQFTELVLQSMAAALGVLLLFGIAGRGGSAIETARLLLVGMVPLGLGAAVANTLLKNGGTKDAQEAPFPRDVAIFALGALFFSLPLAPTDEMFLMAAHAGWWNLAGVVVASLVLTYLTLYELGFRGQRGRLAPRPMFQVLETFMVYVVGLATSALLLFGFGQFHGEPPEVWVQLTVVLGFPAAMGGAAAQVVV